MDDWDGKSFGDLAAPPADVGALEDDGGWKEHFAKIGVARNDIELHAEQIDRPFLKDQRKELLGAAP